MILLIFVGILTSVGLIFIGLVAIAMAVDSPHTIIDIPLGVYGLLLMIAPFVFVLHMIF